MNALETRKKFMEKAKKQTHEALSSKDALIIQAVRSLDDFDAVKSLLQQRVNEWVKINFPDLRANDEVTSKLAAEFGGKEGFSQEKLVEIVGEPKARAIMIAAKESYGAKFDKADTKALQMLGKQVEELTKARKETEEYVTELINSELKNLGYLLEPILAARLLALAGSLKNLAEMPSSTIQVIGAEKSLFKHLRQHTRPPKHGIIFQFPAINAAPMHQRGRIARALAAKLAIAAKADFYTHHFIAPELKESFEKRLQQIRDAPEKPQSAKPKNDYREETDDRFDRGGGWRRDGGKPRFGGGGDRGRRFGGSGGGRPFGGSGGGKRFGGGSRPFGGPSGKPPGEKPFERKPFGESKPFGASKPFGSKPFGEKPFGGKPFGGSGGGKPFGKKPFKRFRKGRH